MDIEANRTEWFGQRNIDSVSLPRGMPFQMLEHKFLGCFQIKSERIWGLNSYRMSMTGADPGYVLQSNASYLTETWRADNGSRP